MSEPDPPPAEPIPPASGRKRVRKRVRVRIEAPRTAGSRVRRLWRKVRHRRREILIWAAYAAVALALIYYAFEKLRNWSPPPAE